MVIRLPPEPPFKEMPTEPYYTDQNEDPEGQKAEA